MSELEKEGVAILKQYGFLVKVNRPLCGFLGRVADALGWPTFKSML